MTVSVLRLFLTVPSVGLQCAIEIFPDNTHFISDTILMNLEGFIERLFQLHSYDKVT